MNAMSCYLTQSRKSARAGFTLVEVLVVVAVLAGLASLAAPSFTESIRKSQINSIQQEFSASFQLARSEAIRRGFPVLLARTTGCGVVLLDTDDWSCGWQIVVDTNRNGAVNAGEPVLQVTTIPNDYGVMHTGLGSVIQLNVWGQAQGVGQRLVITPPPPEGISGPSTTTVCINSGGRIRKLSGEAICI
ncbi:MAG: GspH/FimT family protein [Rhodoferax sp.]|nr:GspH/FimT family protein [Rhodoferax sp.]MDP3653888.1 GspH/FimT family protein [Rhodoferax sp.]